jgi:perosamine synthetase
MGKKTISFGQPMLGEDEISAVTRVLSGPQLVHGPVTKAFEEGFAARMGVAHAVSVSSCTAGLHLSMFVNDIGPGDEVIVPAMTHVATAHAVEFCGAKPVFVDVESDTGNICPDGIASVINENTRAIIPVHYLGLPCDMDEINSLARKENALVVEDCALAVDATYGEDKAGTLGDTGCFSFYPVKHMTTGEGGMVTTNDDELAATIAQCKAFGYDRALGQRAKPGIYDVTRLGYNYRMNEIAAAIGLTQLDKLDSFQSRRQKNFSRLYSSLHGIEKLTVFAPVKDKAVSSHYCLNVVLPRDGSCDRDRIVAKLKADDIGTSVHYPKAVPLMAYYKNKYGAAEGTYPVAEWLAEQTISLPVGPHLDLEDMDRIAASIIDAISDLNR